MRKQRGMVLAGKGSHQPLPLDMLQPAGEQSVACWGRGQTSTGACKGCSRDQHHSM